MTKIQKPENPEIETKQLVSLSYKIPLEPVRFA